MLQDSIIELYQRYGFELGADNDQYLVFFSQGGYFQNAEIVVIDEKFDIANINKKEYEEVGYSVRVREYSDIDSIHDALFNGFFNTVITTKKVNQEYDVFCGQQKKKLVTNNYHYISGSYVENGQFRTSNIVDRIVEILNTEDQQLVLLEASAGYGKTCTSFEVLKEIADKIPSKIPLLTELSKNRTARVFRYVLLSEIDQKFPTLSSNLVTHEIQDGRIVLIIDGFDELLSKSYHDSDKAEKNAGKDAQTMLDTIAQLISNESKTKILLTSRKSSIFAGEAFDDWISQYLTGCNITRLQLTQPSLQDWIGTEKIEALKKNNIILDNLLNPVLLTILRSEPIECFEERYTSNEKLIEQYFGLLLQREKIRQSLPLKVEEQLLIMSNLAAQMVEFDITSEDVEFIKMILSESISNDIEDYLKRYDVCENSSETKPTENEFITKLSQHALLDRISFQSNQVGFINEFVFGLLIAKAVIEDKINISELQGKYLDIVVSAYSVYDIDKRRALYTKIEPSLLKESSQRRVIASLNLLSSINSSYENEYFDGIFFGKNISIANANTFKNCTFSDCIFDTCTINTDAFQTCQFYNCSFYNNSYVIGHSTNCELCFFSCTGSMEFAESAHKCVQEVADDTNYERIVLEQFWKPGYDIAEPNRSFHVLLKGVSTNDRGAMIEAIDSLVKKRILIKKMRVYELNFQKIDDIKDIVKR